MIELIRMVVEGKENSVYLPFTPIKDIEAGMLDLGINIRNKEYVTNSGQVDFWYEYGSIDSKYRLSGSLHYGRFVFEKLKE